MSDIAKKVHNGPNNRLAYTRKRVGRGQSKLGPWLEIGRGRVDPDGVVRAYLDRLPVGGFSGFVCLALPDTPPPTDLQPQRPGETPDSDEESDD